MAHAVHASNVRELPMCTQIVAMLTIVAAVALIKSYAVPVCLKIVFLGLIAPSSARVPRSPFTHSIVTRLCLVHRLARALCAESTATAAYTTPTRTCVCESSHLVAH